MKSLLSIALSLQIAVGVAQNIVSTGRTVTVDEISFYVPPSPVGVVNGDIPLPEDDDFGLVPLTVIQTNNTNLTCEGFSDLKNELLQTDDVVQEAFLKGECGRRSNLQALANMPSHSDLPETQFSTFFQLF